MQPHVAVIHEKTLDQIGLVHLEVIEDDVDLLVRWARSDDLL